jgi:hypothetical protein
MAYTTAVSLFLTLTLLAALQVSSSTLAQAGSASWSRIQQHCDEINRSNGDGRNPALRKELLQMGQADQNGRAFFAPFPSGTGEPATKLTIFSAPKVSDEALTKHLKRIVRANGWPTISLVGPDAAGAALLILRHSPDIKWQRHLLPELERLASLNEVGVTELALIIDHILVSEGKPQKYGTQFIKIRGGKEEAMYVVENLSELDALRASVCLQPIAVYKDVMAKAYGLPISSHMVDSNGAVR